MAAGEEPWEVEGTGASEDRAEGREEPAGHRDRREPHLAGLVWVFPAQQGQRVCDGGWLRAATTAQPAGKAARPHPAGAGRGAPPLAEGMVGPPWIAVLGSGPRVDADNRSHTNPLTGKPDAGDPPVRFGGRGSGKPLSLPLSSVQIDPVVTRSGSAENAR